MRTTALRFAILMILALTVNAVGAQDQELPVSDTQNSGCLKAQGANSEEDQIPTIVLEKEGNILSVQLLNYTSNCATEDFEVNPSFHEGDAGETSTLSVDVIPHGGHVRCQCPYNVSFTISDLEPNSFYLTCWWFEGMVELTEGEELVLKDIWENVSIDGADYTLRKALRYAILKKCGCAGEASIPAELSYEGNTYTVTKVEKDAFKGNTALTKVFIPQTINDFGLSRTDVLERNLFVGCTALEYIEVEEGNPVFCSVDGVLFDREKRSLFTYPAAATRTSYTVPESVKDIAYSAFAHNQHLVNVTIPDEVTDMGTSVFNGCTNLEEVRLSPNLKSLPEFLFKHCEHLKSVTIPQGVTNLGLGVFSGCTSLTSMTMPESVVSAENAVFEDCTSLSEVTLSPNLKSLPGYLFSHCEHLKSVTIPQGVTNLGLGVFSGCASLTSMTMPESVVSTDYAVFEDCTSLSEVTLSPNLKEINQKMFLNCSSLAEIQIPESVTSVLSEAFKNCLSFKKFDLPENVNRLGDSLFYGCKLDSLLIRGFIEHRWISASIFEGMGTETKVFVQPSQVWDFRGAYRGWVYPLPNETDGVTNIAGAVDVSSGLCDLQGRKLHGKPTKGIYIQNGKKYVVR